MSDHSGENRGEQDEEAPIRVDAPSDAMVMVEENKADLSLNKSFNLEKQNRSMQKPMTQALLNRSIQLSEGPKNLSDQQDRSIQKEGYLSLDFGAFKFKQEARKKSC